MRKEINLDQTVIELLEKKAAKNNRKLKNYIEYLCINDVQEELNKKKSKTKN